MRREGDERQERADGERPGRDQARPTTARREQRHEPEDEEHLPDRPHEDEQRDAETQRGRTTGRRCFRYAHEENRDERERGGEQRVARELVEEEDVPGVREERGGRGQRGNRAEAARDAEPRGDRERVEGGDADLADDRAELEEHARDEPRSGRPREDRVRVDDVRVEELRVVEQVPRQVTTGLERERNRDRRVDAERDREDDGLGDRAFCKPHQGATDANDPASRGRHRARVLLLVGRPGGDACYGRAPYAMSAAAPEISVVIPCLNEEEAVGKVVDQALEGIRRSGRTGEVIVVDNASTDRSAEVAAEHGARRRARTAARATAARISRASRTRGASTSSWATPTRRTRCSDLAPFVERLEQGDDLVIGSRFEGTIHGDAMPLLNRFVGNPILTGMLNVLFGVKVSDAHCGMRAVRRDALPALDLHSTGMEFASEMVFKAYRRRPPVSEIPIDYYPRVGESKLNRFGDAWRHVRFMLLYSPSWLYLVPGVRAAAARASSGCSPSPPGPSTSSAARGRSTRCSASSR